MYIRTVCTELPESESLRGSLLISSLASFFPSFLPIKRVVRQERGGGGGGRFTVTPFFCCSPVSCAPASSSVFFSQEWKIASLGIRQIHFPIKKHQKVSFFQQVYFCIIFGSNLLESLAIFMLWLHCRDFLSLFFFFLSFRARPPWGGGGKVEMCALESLLGLH